MAKIEYTNDFSVTQSSKGKIPWMRYDGEPVEDSQFCVEYLNRKLNINLNSHLTEEQRAIAHAFRKMAEENLYLYMGLARMENMEFMTSMPGNKFNKLFIWYGIRVYLNQMKAHGIGRHSHDDFLHIMEDDLRSLSVYLEKFTNLVEYCERMKAAFWPDWEDCITVEGTKTATK